MFETLTKLPSDPLLGIIEKFRADPRAEKIDLGVGVYKNENGETPIFKAVKEAESQLLHEQRSKSYLGPLGNQQFSRSMSQLVLGDELYAKYENRLAALQTPGSCGALCVAAELIIKASPGAKIWVSDPTWANHVPLLGDAGLQIETYPYYCADSKRVLFDAMLACLKQAGAGDLVLLHGCCHNPSGADLTTEQWDQVIALLKEKSLVPLIDLAYQGFGDNPDADVYGIRQAAENLPELIFVVSCSKNFGLYRDRVGMLAVLSKSDDHAQACMSNMVNIVRGMYSMPPDHGGAIVAKILGDAELKRAWVQELSDMRERILSLRILLAEGMEKRGLGTRFAFVKGERGMFSFLGISEIQVERLADDFGIYMTGASRVNIAGLNSANIDYFCDALSKVINGDSSK